MSNCTDKLKKEIAKIGWSLVGLTQDTHILFDNLGHQTNINIAYDEIRLVTPSFDIYMNLEDCNYSDLTKCEHPMISIGRDSSAYILLQKVLKDKNNE